jgi:hypothetical protein
MTTLGDPAISVAFFFVARNSGSPPGVLVVRR